MLFVLALAAVGALAQRNCGLVYGTDDVNLPRHARCVRSFGRDAFLSNASYIKTAHSTALLTCTYQTPGSANNVCCYNAETGALLTAPTGICPSQSLQIDHCGAACCSSCPNSNLYHKTWSGTAYAWNHQTGGGTLTCKYKQSASCDYDLDTGKRIHKLATDTGCPPVSTDEPTLCLVQV